MNSNTLEDEKNLTVSLITLLATLKEAPTKDIIIKKAEALANISGYRGNLDPIINEAMIAVDSRMGEGVSLVDIEAKHDAEWVFKRKNEIEWTYSEAYEKYLKNQNWHPSLVQSLSDVTTRILGHLQDPSSEGSWNRRGLVIGHVQSGKTANYIGLVARAADAGYKFIVVIAGIHNNLRKQTQERIDEGFIGWSSNPNNRVRIGVGLNKDYPHPATLTTIYDDFNKNTADKSVWEINDFSKPIILVIKKNVRTLDALHKWLKELNAQGDGRIADVPMLMIDDEADNASINTNKPDLDPTRTNSMIRKILGLFVKSCYLGYTATPFANVFINPESYDEETREELFPRDFLYCIDAPTTYFGPEKVFLNDDATISNITVPITDCEDYIPWSHKKDDTILELPPSLYLALHQFVLGRAIRNLRGHSVKHCSMMINVSRFVAVQKAVRDLISLYEKKLHEAVKANYAMPEEISGKNQYMKTLKHVFENDFMDCGFTWMDIKRSLWSVFENLRVFVINSKTDEALDYKKYEKDGDSLTAIAVGGLSLSRGLTIEGLSVSYMYRNTRMYDTLMQMGRWFGYRFGYEDLCRVHLSQDSINWYSHIANVSEELRQQINRMRRDRLSPRQFGLYVRAHPDSLLITATNKMRSGERVSVKENFSGHIVESYYLPTDNEINTINKNLISEFWKNGFGLCTDTVKEEKKGLVFRDVKVGVIENFLSRFIVHPTFAEKKSAVISYLQAISENYPLCDVLLISIAGNSKNHSEFCLGFQERSSKGWNQNGWLLNGYRVASKGDEKFGLDLNQILMANRIALDDKNNRSKDKSPSDVHYREVRNKPLLMLHVLSPTPNPVENQNLVPAFGVSFPMGDYTTEVTVIANKDWIRIHGSFVDIPDEDEDQDE